MNTTNAVRRRQRRDEAKAARGPRNVPVVGLHGHIGICQRCDRRGLVADEGICVGYRQIDAPVPFEPRSKRCDAINDQRLHRFAKWSCLTPVLRLAS